jgi:hypothetical protein
MEVPERVALTRRGRTARKRRQNGAQGQKLTLAHARLMFPEHGHGIRRHSSARTVSASSRLALHRSRVAF